MKFENYDSVERLLNKTPTWEESVDDLEKWYDDYNPYKKSRKDRGTKK